MRKSILLFLIAASLSATPVTLTSAGGLVDNNGIYIGPYTLSIYGASYPALCVDYTHESVVGSTWNAALTAVQPGTVFAEEVFLYELITAPGADRISIQHAAWSLTDPAYAPDAGSQPYIAAAQANQPLGLSSFLLVTDTAGVNQQFLIAVPEPSFQGPFILAIVLIFGIITIVRVRRSK